MNISTELEQVLVDAVGRVIANICDTPDLEAAEEASLAIAKRVSTLILDGLVRRQVRVTGYACGNTKCKCGGTLSNVGNRPRRICSQAGEVEVRRPYYHCKKCGHCFAPWDAASGVNQQPWTPGLKALVCAMMGHVPYGVGVELLHRLSVVDLAISSAEGIVGDVGDRLRESERTRADLCAAEARAQDAELLCDTPRTLSTALPARAPVGDRLYVGLDACKAHIDGGWRDVKVGVVYTAKPDEDGIDTLHDKAYVAAREAADTFGWSLRSQACSWGQSSYKQTVVLADGAEYNWNLAQYHFPKAVQILDYWHAAEHVHDVAKIAFPPESAEKALAWATVWCDRLLKEGPAELIKELGTIKPTDPEHSETVQRERAYFEHNAHRMDYPTYRQAGMMIGSGPIEAACKSVVIQRMRGTGMRWSDHGSSTLLACRTAMLNNDYARLQDASKAA
jgi:hypothetical protein